MKKLTGLILIVLSSYSHAATFNILNTQVLDIYHYATYSAIYLDKTSNCTNPENRVDISTSHPNYNVLISTLLTARTANLTVTVGINGCNGGRGIFSNDNESYLVLED